MDSFVEFAFDVWAPFFNEIKGHESLRDRAYFMTRTRDRTEGFRRHVSIVNEPLWRLTEVYGIEKAREFDGTCRH